jgi:hypothetical protein
MCVALAASCVAVLFLAVWSLDRPDAHRYGALARRGVTTTAVVTTSEPSNHNLLRYRFVVAGRSYESGDFASTVKASDYPPGSKLQIVYDALDPNSTCVCSPGENLRGASLVSGLAAGVFLSVGLVPVMIYGLGYRRGWWNPIHTRESR